MNDIHLQQLSRMELAQLLARCRRHSVQWHKVRGECERRARRWNTVMHYAWLSILGCMFAVSLAKLLS